jgi:hypothetical protein
VHAWLGIGGRKTSPASASVSLEFNRGTLRINGATLSEDSTRRDVASLLGEPDRRMEFRREDYSVYNRLGLTVAHTTASGRLTQAAVYYGEGDGNFPYWPRWQFVGSVRAEGHLLRRDATIAGVRAALPQLEPFLGADWVFIAKAGGPGYMIEFDIDSLELREIRFYV